jgi:hypothetical protein
MYADIEVRVEADVDFVAEVEADVDFEVQEVDVFSCC